MAHLNVSSRTFGNYEVKLRLLEHRHCNTLTADPMDLINKKATKSLYKGVLDRDESYPFYRVEWLEIPSHYSNGAQIKMCVIYFWKFSFLFRVRLTVVTKTEESKTAWIRESIVVYEMFCFPFLFWYISWMWPTNLIYVLISVSLVKFSTSFIWTI